MPEAPLPIVQLKIPPDTSLMAQLTPVLVGLLSKRAAAFSLASGIAYFGRLSVAELWFLGAITCTAIVCFTWERVAQLHAPKAP